jgi:hypothetical protein
MSPRDMFCLRNVSVDTLHKRDTEDDDDDDDNHNNNNNKNKNKHLICLLPLSYATKQQKALPNVIQE